MYVIFDVTTNTLMGPFDTEESAVGFKVEAEAELNDSNQSLDLYQLTEPTEWMLDNFSTSVVELV